MGNSATRTNVDFIELATSEVFKVEDMNISLRCLDIHFPNVFCLNRYSAERKRKKKRDPGQIRLGYVLKEIWKASQLQDFTLLRCIVNFQEVKASPQLVCKHFLTVESVFMVHLVGLEIYRTGTEKNMRLVLFEIRLIHRWKSYKKSLKIVLRAIQHFLWESHGNQSKLVILRCYLIAISVWPSRAVSSLVLIQCQGHSPGTSLHWGGEAFQRLS